MTAWPQEHLAEVKVNVDSAQACDALANALVLRLKLQSKVSRGLVFVCIGTDRSTGDSLGPIAGTLLQSRRFSGTYVYGTLENPVHATNLEEIIAMLNEKHPRDTIVAIDACLGRSDNIGYITIGHGPLRPGAGVNKTLPAVGNLHITGIVNVGGFMEYFVLQNTRLYLVYRLAEAISTAIGKALERLSYQEISN